MRTCTPVTITMPIDLLSKIDAEIAALKESGRLYANRSALIRLALQRVNILELPQSDLDSVNIPHRPSKYLSVSSEPTSAT